MKANTLAIVVSFILGGVAGAVALKQLDSGGSQIGASQHSLTTLELGSTSRGELTQASAINLKDGSRYQAFRFLPAQVGLLRIQQHGALEGHLTLLNADHEIIQNSVLDELYVMIDETSRQTPLTLVVSGSSASAYGPFRLETEWLEVMSERSLEENQEVTGYLTGSVNQYEVTIEQFGIYQFDMSSSKLDSYLTLTGLGLNQTDDDGGDGLNARLVLMLQPGVYQLGASTSYSVEEHGFGQYQLRLQQLNTMQDMQQGGELEVGQRVQGMMQQSEVVEYSFRLPQERRLRIALDSDFFDTVLEVQGAGVRFSDDDGGIGTNSLIDETFPAGDYRIQVRAYGAGQGVFSLRIH